jgi:hypothetical protein
MDFNSSKEIEKAIRSLLIMVANMDRSRRKSRKA